MLLHLDCKLEQRTSGVRIKITKQSTERETHHVGQNAKLKLTVICDDKLATGSRFKRFANTVPIAHSSGKKQVGSTSKQAKRYAYLTDLSFSSAGWFYVDTIHNTENHETTLVQIEAFSIRNMNGHQTRLNRPSLPLKAVPHPPPLHSAVFRP
jgi:hypothetical protein